MTSWNYTGKEKKRKKKKCSLKYLRQVLAGHDAQFAVSHVVAVPESGLVATASEDGLRIFPLGGEGNSLHARKNASSALASLTGCSVDCLVVLVDHVLACFCDILVCGEKRCEISTWCTSTGQRLDSFLLGCDANLSAMAAIGDAGLVVGTAAGALIFFSHNGGRDLCEVGRGKPHRTEDSDEGEYVDDVAVFGDVVVSVTDESEVTVWSARTKEQLTSRRRHQSSGSSGSSGFDELLTVAICENFVATGNLDVPMHGRSVRVYKNGGDYPLVKTLSGIHEDTISYVVFVTEDLLMSASADQTVAFTSISTGKTIARVAVGFAIASAAILSNGQLAASGQGGNAVLFSPPDEVAGFVKVHAASLCWAGAGKAVAIDGADIDPALPSTNSQIVEKIDDGSSFKMEELKAAAASGSKSVIEMYIEELSRLLSAVMFNFQEEWRPHMPVLAKCLKKLFATLSIDGGVIVKFPYSELLDIVMEGLKKDAAFAWEEGVSTIMIWRLRCYLLRLRGLDGEEYLLF